MLLCKDCGKVIANVDHVNVRFGLCAGCGNARMEPKPPTQLLCKMEGVEGTFLETYNPITSCELCSKVGSYIADFDPNEIGVCLGCLKKSQVTEIITVIK